MFYHYIQLWKYEETTTPVVAILYQCLLNVSVTLSDWNLKIKKNVFQYILLVNICKPTDKYIIYKMY